MKVSSGLPLPSERVKTIEDTKPDGTTNIYLASNTALDDLTDEDIKLLRNELANYHIEGDLRREVTMNIKRLQEIGSFRGLRHKRKLPCRGQRTKTNARTQRGKKTGPVSKKK